jgi:hypothetical protein
VGLGGDVQDRRVHLVVDDVEHGGDQFGRLGDGGLAGLEVDLHAVRPGEGLELRAELGHRVALLGEEDAAAEADPLQLRQHVAVLLADVVEVPGQAGEVVVLAVEVEHDPADEACGFAERVGVAHAEAAVLAGGVGEVEVRVADPRVDAHPDLEPLDVLMEGLELRDRVEDDLVGVLLHLPDVFGREADAVGVRLLAELLVAQPGLVQPAAGGAVHVLAHEREDRPGGEALERQHRLRPREVANALDDLEIPQQLAFVDQVIGGCGGCSWSPGLGKEAASYKSPSPRATSFLVRLVLPWTAAAGRRYASARLAAPGWSKPRPYPRPLLRPIMRRVDVLKTRVLLDPRKIEFWEVYGLEPGSQAAEALEV